MNGKTVTALAGGGLLILGLVIGLIPLSAAGSTCGSAFSGANQHSLAFNGALAACESLRSAVRLAAIAVMLIGGGVGLGGLIAAHPEIVGKQPSAQK